MAFDKGIYHWPVPFHLGFLRLDQILDRKEFEHCASLIFDCGASAPENFKISCLSQAGHYIYSQAFGLAALAPKMDRMAAK